MMENSENEKYKELIIEVIKSIDSVSVLEYIYGFTKQAAIIWK